jgi:hypothetical protein
MKLQEFLEERAKKEEAEGARTKIVREEWTSAVSKLVNTIEEWLRRADTKKVLTIERETYRIREKNIGTYGAQGLMVRLGAQEVRVVPIARYSIGSMVGDSLGESLRYGRVDVTDGAQKLMLYRPGGGDQWILVDEQTYQGKPLDQAAFEEAFLKLVQ